MEVSKKSHKFTPSPAGFPTNPINSLAQLSQESSSSKANNRKSEKLNIYRIARQSKSAKRVTSAAVDESDGCVTFSRKIK